MSKTASKEAVEQLHNALVSELTELISGGIKTLDKDGNAIKETAPAAYFKEARELLKDNGVTADITANAALGSLVESLPFPEGDGEEIRQHH